VAGCSSSLQPRRNHNSETARSPVHPHKNAPGACKLRNVDAPGPWTGHLTKPALEMTPIVREIIDVLNRRRTRATYGAVGELLRVPARSVSRWLGERRPEASWVVAKKTLRPTGYADGQLHPDLPGSGVITTGAELRRLLDTLAAR